MRLNFFYVAWIFDLRIQGSVALDHQGGLQSWSTSSAKRLVALTAERMQLRAEQSCPPGAPCSCNCACNPGRFPPPPPPPMPNPPVLTAHSGDWQGAPPPPPRQESPEPFVVPAPHWLAPSKPKMPPLPGIGSYVGAPEIKPLKESFTLPKVPKDFGVPPKAPWETPAPRAPHLIMPRRMTPAPPYTQPPRPTTTPEPTTTHVDPWWERTTFPWWHHTTKPHTWTTTTAASTTTAAASTTPLVTTPLVFLQQRKHVPASMVSSSNDQSYVVQPGGICKCSSPCH